MSHILRLPNKGVANTNEGWESCGVYSDVAINSIPDGTGESVVRSITSIPSPFARMYLAHIAFQKVTESLNGGANQPPGIYDKVVSQSLDVAEIFFNYERLEKDFQIIRWEERDLDVLLKSEHPGHRGFAAALKLFLEQDQDAFLFDKMGALYFLHYRGGMELYNIIGGTSPISLFFTPDNDLSYVGEHVQFGQYRPFGDQFRHLHERDKEFIRFYYRLARATSQRVNGNDVFAYVETCIKKLSAEVRDYVRSGGDDVDYWGTLRSFETPGKVYILDIELRYRTHNIGVMVSQSDFLIAPSESYQPAEGESLPLVLPCDTFHEPLRYVEDRWDSQTDVPVSDSRELHRRTLPGNGSEYPYLTMGDFLEKRLMRIDSKLDRSHFFDGNRAKEDNYSYALPLTPLFFRYFCVDDLMNMRPGNRPMLEMEDLPGNSIKATLRIPIKRQGSFITYSRIYSERTIDESGGESVEKNFTLGIYPPTRFDNDRGQVEVTPLYRLLLVNTDDRPGLVQRYELTAWRNGELNPLKLDEPILVGNEGQFGSFKIYPLSGVQFDYLQVACDREGTQGIIVPKLPHLHMTADEFKFAVDFGTSNTHVEYRREHRGAPQPLDIGNGNDRQIALMHSDVAADILIAIQQRVLPLQVGDNQPTSFPTRTALIRSKRSSSGADYVPIGHGTVSMLYGRQLPGEFSEEITGLKWTRGNNLDVKCFMRSLLFTLRNKVVLNGASPENARFVWFYPTSMTSSRYDMFSEQWKGAVAEFFGQKAADCIKSLPESVAPYEFYKQSDAAVSTIVNFDIGGGTTDIIFVEKGEQKLATSYRFAGDDIFGTERENTRNGIIDYYYDYYKRALADSQDMLLQGLLEEARSRERYSVELAAFFFSLKWHYKVQESMRGMLDFQSLLTGNEEFKICFLLFFMAHIYHAAHLMKLKGLEKPRHISFSGNASGLVEVLSSNKERTASVAQRIFAYVYGDEIGKDKLEIPDSYQNPSDEAASRKALSKAATCKGGIHADEYPTLEEARSLSAILSGRSMTELLPAGYTYADLSKEIDAVVDDVWHRTDEFLEMVFAVNGQLKFKDLFGVKTSTLDLLKGIIGDSDTKASILHAIKGRAKNEEGSEEVEETLFFHGVKGVIIRMSNEIYKTISASQA